MFEFLKKPYWVKEYDILFDNYTKLEKEFNELKKLNERLISLLEKYGNKKI